MTELETAFEETGVQLDRIIDALMRKKPNPKTVVTYDGGTVQEYLIEGELRSNSIPNKTDAVEVEVGAAVTSIGNDAFSDCWTLKSISIPGSVRSIGNDVFYNCSGLTSVTIGNGVTSIGYSAFKYCSNLSSIRCLATTAPTVDEYTFGENSSSYTGYSTRGSNVLRVPQGATRYNTSYWADPLQDSEKCGFHIEYI